MSLKRTHAVTLDDTNPGQTAQHSRRCSRCLKPIDDRFLLQVAQFFYHESCAFCSVCKLSLVAINNNNITHNNHSRCCVDNNNDKLCDFDCGDNNNNNHRSCNNSVSGDESGSGGGDGGGVGGGSNVNDNDKKSNSSDGARHCGVCYERDGALYCRMHYPNVQDMLDKSTKNEQQIQQHLQSAHQKQQQEQQKYTQTQHECAGCRAIISPTDMVYKLKLGVIYHVKCHVCYKCGKQLAPGERIIVYEATKSVSCVSHYTQRFTPKNDKNENNNHDNNEEKNENMTGNGIDNTSIIANVSNRRSTTITTTRSNDLDETTTMNGSQPLANASPQLSYNQRNIELINSGSSGSSNFTEIANSDKFFSDRLGVLMPQPMAMPYLLFDHRQPQTPVSNSLFTLMNDNYETEIKVGSYDSGSSGSNSSSDKSPLSVFTAGEISTRPADTAVTTTTFRGLPKPVSTIPMLNEDVLKTNNEITGDDATSMADGLRSEDTSINILTYATTATTALTMACTDVSSITAGMTFPIAGDNKLSPYLSSGDNFTQLLNSSYLNMAHPYLGGIDKPPDFGKIDDTGSSTGFMPFSLNSFGAFGDFISDASVNTSFVASADKLGGMAYLPPLPGFPSCRNTGLSADAANVDNLHSLQNVNATNSMLFLQEQQQAAMINPYNLEQDAFLNNLMSANNSVAPTALTGMPSTLSTLPSMDGLGGLGDTTHATAAAAAAVGDMPATMVGVNTNKKSLENVQLKMQKNTLKNRSNPNAPYPNESGNNILKKSPKKSKQQKTITNNGDDVGIDKVLKDRLKKFGIFRSSSPVNEATSSNPAQLSDYNPTQNQSLQKQQQQPPRQQQQQQQQQQVTQLQLAQHLQHQHVLPAETIDLTASSEAALAFYNVSFPAEYNETGASTEDFRIVTMFNEGGIMSLDDKKHQYQQQQQQQRDKTEITTVASASAISMAATTTTTTTTTKYPFEMYAFGEMYAEADAKFLKRRGPRTSIKQEQLDLLNTIFASTPKPSKHARAKLAVQTGLNMRVIQVWFQNRRSKERRLKHLCNFLRHCEQNSAGYCTTGDGDEDEENSRLFAKLRRDFDARMYATGGRGDDGAPIEFSDYLEYKIKEKFATFEEKTAEDLLREVKRETPTSKLEPDYAAPDSIALLDASSNVSAQINDSADLTLMTTACYDHAESRDTYDAMYALDGNVYTCYDGSGLVQSALPLI